MELDSKYNSFHAWYPSLKWRFFCWAIRQSLTSMFGVIDFNGLHYIGISGQPEELRWHTRSHFYQTRSPWSVDQGSADNHSPVKNVTPTVTKLCVMWEGQALPHDTKFGNCRDKIVDSKVFPSWSLIHGSSWSGSIKVEPGVLFSDKE